MSKNYIEKGYDKFILNVIIVALAEHETVTKDDIIRSLCAADSSRFDSNNISEVKEFLDYWLDQFNCDEVFN